MQGYNCIMVFNQNRSSLLFCKRRKDPYKGLYNLVGGKIESGEESYAAAYRELEEETGITRQNIRLYHMMDFTYYNQDCYVEVYAGQLLSEVELTEEANPLVWLNANENFFDIRKYAGEGNIGHMVEQVKEFGFGVGEAGKETAPEELNNNSLCIGVDGCKAGWIAAVFDHGKLVIERYTKFQDIVGHYPQFDELLLDMVIGLPSNREHIRPDTFARKIIKERASTIFPAPCRQAVYAGTVAMAYEENERVLGKKFTPLTVGIIPKMLEIDVFLQSNPHLKNKIKESHPEVCFAKLNGGTVLSKKSEVDGIGERIQILSKYISEITTDKLAKLARGYRCNIDDIVDAICLAVSANLVGQEKYQVIPESPMEDETGLKMQMVIPE